MRSWYRIIPLFSFSLGQQDQQQWLSHAAIPDYEVLLVCQIGQLVHADEDDKRFVACGIVTSTRLIGCAKPIMVVVLASLQFNGTPTVEDFGVSLPVAVILDTAVLRRLLVPVSMMLLERMYRHRAHVLVPGSVA